jgi:predicted RNA binding protein YcfA (HicA-like mRNA interferase family)
MKVREVIKLIEDDGWVEVRQRGSHRQYIHAMKPGRVTVAGNLGVEMRSGTLANVMRQAGLKGPKR